jgi:hypothetical protein
MSRKRVNTKTLIKPARRRVGGDKSVAAAMLALLRQGKDVRSRKTRRLRGAVRAGRYESDMKLAIAMQKLIESL